eukprot:353171-Chlamydomonas_euryale.AAC.5
MHEHACTCSWEKNPCANGHAQPVACVNFDALVSAMQLECLGHTTASLRPCAPTPSASVCYCIFAWHQLQSGNLANAPVYLLQFAKNNSHFSKACHLQHDVRISAAPPGHPATRCSADLGGESRPHGRPPKQVSPGSHAAAADIPPVADPFKTPLEAAAAAAAYEVRSKVCASRVRTLRAWAQGR